MAPGLLGAAVVHDRWVMAGGVDIGGGGDGVDEPSRPAFPKNPALKVPAEGELEEPPLEGGVERLLIEKFQTLASASVGHCPVADPLPSPARGSTSITPVLRYGCEPSTPSARQFAIPPGEASDGKPKSRTAPTLWPPRSTARRSRTERRTRMSTSQYTKRLTSGGKEPVEEQGDVCGRGDVPVQTVT